jgi:hypothetical protein
MVPFESDRIAPITSSIGFIRAPVGDVADALEQWGLELERTVTRKSFKGGRDC